MSVQDVRITQWDLGVFTSELIRQSLFPRDITSAATKRVITPPKGLGNPGFIPEGTYHGSKAAATEMYRSIEQRFASYFDVANFESSIPQKISFAAKKQLYTFQQPGSDKYPPHLNMIPEQDQVSLLKIFDFMRLLDTGSLLGSVIPEKILDFLHSSPDQGGTIAALEQRNKILRSEGKDIFTDPNIGDRPDWYTDAVFAQQQFTGTNPTTITRASAEWVEQFIKAAKAQNAKMFELLSTAPADSLYIQDCSYFRAAVGAAPDASMMSDDKTRFACAAVSLFQLSEGGTLHPLAIVIDYKKSIENSVVIFNVRLHSSDPTDSEATDWPWRYAKTCAQISDWVRHEVTIHLTNTHLVEEVVIVAAHRAFPVDHIVYRLLQPHWLKTLSLNSAARSALIPQVIVKIVGVSDSQLYAFINDAYSRFDWTSLYVPKDLANRGFPPDKLKSDQKFHNYTYGRNMILMWTVLRKFVASVLATSINSDDQVAKDTAIQEWVQEMRSASGGMMRSFPDLKTVNDLVDVVTMCIHIASPQHTAVNYLQEYYQSFVISKPPALCTAPPTTLQALLKYKEPDLMKALPAGRPREWLLASHLPHLLSYRVAEDQNLMNYAVSLAKLAALNNETAIANAAATLYTDLISLIDVFNQNSNEMDDQVKKYDVMNPDATAVSILI